MFAHIPISISLNRVLMASLIVELLNEHQYPLSFLVFTLAGISDGVDGWLAKAYNLQSNFGAMRDTSIAIIISVIAFTTLTSNLIYLRSGVQQGAAQG